MRRPVHKALDRPAVFFVFRGRFTGYFLAGVAVAVTAGLLAGRMVAGRMVAGYVGVVIFAALFITDAYAVVRLQSRMTERELARYIASRRLPSCIRVSSSDLDMICRFRNGTLWK